MPDHPCSTLRFGLTQSWRYPSQPSATQTFSIKTLLPGMKPFSSRSLLSSYEFSLLDHENLHFSSVLLCI